MTVGFTEILSFAIVAQLFLFILFLVSSKSSRKLSNIILAIFLFAQLIVVLNRALAGFTPFLREHFTYIFHSAVPFSFVWAPTLYLYSRSLMYKNFRLSRIHILHAIPFLFTFIYISIFYFFRSNAVRLEVLSRGGLFSVQQFILISIVRHILIGSYLAAALRHMKSYRIGIKEQFSSLEKINLSWLRTVLIGYAIAWMVSLFHFIYLISTQSNPPILGAVVYIMFFIFFNIIYYFGFRQPEIFAGIDEKKPYAKSTLSKDNKSLYADKLKTYIKNNKPFCRPSLTLDELASNLQIPARYLSQTINEIFEMSFYDYINGLRIEEFKRHMLETADEKMTILEGLYAVGFNSKSSFNNAFKKHVGMTPTAFIRSQKIPA